MNIDLKTIKLIIWDMDNTFWNGILTEGGVEPSTRNIEFVHNLTNAGIINSICSKNYENDVKGKLEEYGVWDEFVFPSINWEQKGVRVQEIISNMSLRPDNVLFIDDDAKNLAIVKQVNPGITVSEPSVISDLIVQLSSIEKKDTIHKRLNQYKVLEKKNKDKQLYKSNDNFLLESQIRVAMIEENVSDNIDRIFELIGRTNQLNYTKNRCTLGELTTILEDDSYRCGYVYVIDKYGDYGISGFYALKLTEKRLVHFLFSCRTMGMGVEQYVYAKLGHPSIDIVGDVVTPLESEGDVPWISCFVPNNSDNILNEK